MRDLAILLNEMKDAGVLEAFALFGAMAQMRYTAAVATFDADVLIAVPGPPKLDALSDVYRFCADRGYRPEGEAIRVGSWPVQFIVAFDPLTREAMQQATTVNYDGVPLRVVRADHLAVIALSVGRAKDFARVVALMESGSVTREQLGELAARHGLAGAWSKFVARFLEP